MHLPGNVITATRDNWRRIAGVALPGGTSVSLVYNFRNLVTSFTDELSRTSSRTYDNAGRLITATNPKGETHTYTYNSNSWVTAITNGRGATRNFAHSARGDVTSLTLPDGAVEQWSYLGTGQTSGYTSPPGGPWASMRRLAPPPSPTICDPHDEANW